MVAGAVHATLERLERKGLLASGSAPERRFAAAAHPYRLQPAGIRALKDARETVDQIWDGLKWPLVKARSIA